MSLDTAKPFNNTWPDKTFSEELVSKSEPPMHLLHEAFTGCALAEQRNKVCMRARLCYRSPVVPPLMLPV